MTSVPLSTYKDRLAGFAALAWILLSSPARADTPLMPAELGTGGASRGDLSSTTATATAPGTLALRGRYEIGLGGALGPYTGRSLQAVAIDSTTGPVALGILYDWRQSTPPASGDALPGWRLPEEDTANPTRSTTVVGSLASAWAHRSVGLGAGLSYHRINRRFGGSEQAFNAIASLGVQVQEQFVLSVTGENLVPVDFPDLPLRIGAGMGWFPVEPFGLVADIAAPFDDGEVAPEYAVGLRGTIAETVTLRSGYTHESADPLHYLSLGLGLGNPSMSLDYGVRIAVGPEAEDTWNRKLPSWHGLGLVLVF